MGTPSRRLFGGLLVLAFALSAGGLLTAALAGQKPAPKEEEEEPVKPKKKVTVPDEEEEGQPAKPRKVIEVPDDDAPTKPRPRRGPPPLEQATTLVEALRGVKNPELRKFYTELKTPHDDLTVKSLDTTRTYHVEPLTHYYPGEGPRLDGGGVYVFPLDQDWKRPKNLPSQHYASARRIEPYEEIVLDRVEKLLDSGLEGKSKDDPSYLSRADILRAAELALAAADRFHASQRIGPDGVRQGPDWEPVGKRLHERLIKLQLDRLDAMVSAGDWDGASAYARTLADAYTDAKEREPVAGLLARLITEGLKDGDSTDRAIEARNRLETLQDIFPGSQAAGPVAEALRRQAKGLFDRAKELSDAKKHEEAQALMRLAQALAPSLPGLGDELAKLQSAYSILRVGVRDLPVKEKMFPGQAVTDADLRAVELQYEGLVKLRDQPGVGQRYEPALAAGLPRLVPLGREFRIARGAAWPDGKPVSAADVRATLTAMKGAGWPGHGPLRDKMVEDAELGGDAFRLNVRLGQGYIDPLSLMTFKVLPAAVARPNALPAGAPAGSGPFVYKHTQSVLERQTAVFVANPGYAGRDGKLGLPRIRAVQFTQVDDPAAALKANKIDLALDLSAAQAQELRGADNVTVLGPLANRRVYFLAVNHRRDPLKGNPWLRRAIAKAIDRQKLLDDHFRGGDDKAHHALNGPFPAGSWAIDPKNVPAELYDLEGAKSQARQAVKEAHGPIALTLKYPAGDPAVKAAVQAICDAVNKELDLDKGVSVKLGPVSVEAHKLREDVERDHDYDLAYYHYDHPSDACWLGPLFDLSATDKWGSNYPGYSDSDLQARFEKAKNHRDFAEVRRVTRLIHQMLDQRMPLIPLWQLDTFVAHRKALKPKNVDPLLIFTDVEQWTLAAP